MNGHGVTVGCGTLYEVRRVGHDRWSESVLHNFGVGQDQETNPSCVLLRGMDGTLYGTIQYPPDIFAFKADNERVLYTFLINTSLLGDPSSGVISDAGGRLYGTTAGIVERYVTRYVSPRIRFAATVWRRRRRKRRSAIRSRRGRLSVEGRRLYFPSVAINDDQRRAAWLAAPVLPSARVVWAWSTTLGNVGPG